MNTLIRIKHSVMWLTIPLCLTIITGGFSVLFSPKPELYRYTYYSRAFFDENGELLRLSLAQDDRYRIFQPIENIPPELIDATILYEDQEYFNHLGVDAIALFRALWSTYIVKQRRIGASTITMQVARLRWNITSSTISGKIEQIFRALQLSRHYSKEEVLEAYFNLASYGQNVEGIGAASLIYFKKPSQRLSWLESLTLSVVPQNPNKRAPATTDGLHNIQQARTRLFERFVSRYPEYNDKKSLLDLPLSVSSLQKLPFDAPHFTNFHLSKLNPWQSGKITTTLNRRQQKIVESRVFDYIKQREREGIFNAAALLVNYETNEVKAMVGSADFFSKSINGQVNGVIAKRSPGSALKPFVYALAMDEGLIHPMTMLRDAPTRFGGFSPENFDKKFLGPVFAKTALIESRNVPAVELQHQLSGTSFYDFLQAGGVSDLKPSAHYGLALALGGGEVTMLEVATLYAGLARGGLITPISTLKNSPKEPGKQLLSPQASFLTLDILRQNPPPEATYRINDQDFRNDIAWKTGTSWAFRDAWAVGISGPYVAVVWIGNFNGEGNPTFVGRTAAGPLLFSILGSIYPDQGWRLEDQSNVEQLGIKKVDVCASTGDLPGKHCPQTLKSWFIPGVSPIKVSDVHRSIAIDSKTGLRACDLREESIDYQVYEIWPSDFLRIFKQAGISLNSPPPYHADCLLEDKNSTGLQPKIVSPISSADYLLQKHEENIIEFSAIVDSDVEKLYWFVNNNYIGNVSPTRSLSWKAKVGTHNITLVDDFGRSSSKLIRVINVY